jgi:short-subunit dehydrogenase
LAFGSQKNAIIVGASSGIGAALARVLNRDGYSLLLIARRRVLLESLRAELGDSVRVLDCDVCDTQGIVDVISNEFAAKSRIDLVINCAGCGELNPNLDLELEYPTLETNVKGFVAVAGTVMQKFIGQNHGHFVNLSSVAALRGSGAAPAYNASKAFQSNYTEGLLLKALMSSRRIYVTDVQPGFVDTRMAKGDGLFWVAPVSKAAAQIYAAIKRKRRHVYVTRRWRLVAWLLRIVPSSLLARG